MNVLSLLHRSAVHHLVRDANKEQLSGLMTAVEHRKNKKPLRDLPKYQFRAINRAASECGDLPPYTTSFNGATAPKGRVEACTTVIIKMPGAEHRAMKLPLSPVLGYLMYPTALFAIST